MVQQCFETMAVSVGSEPLARASRLGLWGYVRAGLHGPPSIPAPLGVPVHAQAARVRAGRGLE